ncbi:MAG: immune inhibitor A, partial [Clostridiales bacterium]|nr:immune inhibitor A [Clostridiales bacterium]
MSKKNILLVVILAALLMLASFSVAYAAEPKGLADFPDPIDPQSWQQNKDRTWDNFIPNPVIDWETDLIEDGLANAKATSEGRNPKQSTKGAIILVDFIDKPMITSQPIGGDLFGFNLYKKEGGGLEDVITKNPVLNHMDRDTLADWWCDFLNKKLTGNGGSTFNEFSCENSFGKWSVELTGFGPYTLNGLELQYGGLNQAHTPPSLYFRGSLLSEATAAARAGADGKAPWDPDEFDFFFVIHAGYDESGVWLPFGMMQFPGNTLAEAKLTVPDLYGPKTKLLELETLFTAHPEHVERLATKSSSTQLFRDEAAKIAAHRVLGTLGDYVFKFPESEWTWATTCGNAAPTRYVAWTAWAARISYWSGASSWSYSGSKITGGSRSLRYSVQGENDGMATFAHEYGHISGIGDNYDNSYTVRRSPITEPWELMSRGSFAGPFGDQARWTVPGIEGGSVPVNMMAFNKTASNFYDSGDVLVITNQALAARTPLVTEIVARNIPLNNRKTPANPDGVYKWLEDDYGLVNPNYYKALQLNFGSGAWADQASTSPGNRKSTGFTWNSSTVTRMFVEVVQRAGYDSFAPDDGVIISRNNGIVDSHLYDRAMIDYVQKDGFGPGKDDYASHTLGSMGQLYDAAFHVGKSFVDTGYYASIYDPADPHYTSEEARYYAGEGNLSWQKAMIKPGSQVQWEEQDGRPIVSGDTVNEWHDPYNNLHFYILDKTMHPAKNGEFLSYTVGVLHGNGVPVGGDLIVTRGKFESADPGRVATQWFTVKNTGSATDIIRIAADCALDFVLLNDLYAIDAGETIEIPVYVKIPADNPEFKALTFTASSESNTAKESTVIISDFSAGISAPAQIYIKEGNRIDYVVSVAKVANEGANLFTIEATFDAANLNYVGYTFGPSLLTYSPTQGSFSYNVISGKLTLDMFLAKQGMLLTADTETPLVTFHFTVKDGVPAGPDKTVVDSFLSNVKGYCFIAGKSSPVDAIVTKPGAPTKILLHPLGFEGGDLDEGTISWLIYHHLYK